MPITILGNTPGPVADRTDIPAPKTKIVPRAKDEEENTWPSGDALAHGGGTDPGTQALIGDPGEVGGNNFDGGDTPLNLTFVVGGFTGAFDVTVLGGIGGGDGIIGPTGQPGIGGGGKGGTGGDGGEGQDGGKGGDEGGDAAGGKGGDGGPGGIGGNGGNGGNANSFDLYIPNPNDVVGINTTILFSGGFRGRGGEGGIGGNPGLGGFTGSDPNKERAQQGNHGPIGQPGRDGGHNGNTGHLNIYVGVHP